MPVVAVDDIGAQKYCAKAQLLDAALGLLDGPVTISNGEIMPAPIICRDRLGRNHEASRYRRGQAPTANSGSRSGTLRRFNPRLG